MVVKVKGSMYGSERTRLSKAGKRAALSHRIDVDLEKHIKLSKTDGKLLSKRLKS